MRQTVIATLAILVLGISATSLSSPATATETVISSVYVEVNDTPIEGKLLDGITYVPLRALVENYLDGTVTWDQETQSAIADVPLPPVPAPDLPPIGPPGTVIQGPKETQAPESHEDKPTPTPLGPPGTVIQEPKEAQDQSHEDKATPTP